MAHCICITLQHAKARKAVFPPCNDQLLGRIIRAVRGYNLEPSSMCEFIMKICEWTASADATHAANHLSLLDVLAQPSQALEQAFAFQSVRRMAIPEAVLHPEQAQFLRHFSRSHG